MTTVSKYAQTVKYLATGIVLSVFLAACQTPDSKVQDAKGAVADAKQDLKEVQREVSAEWQQAWLEFKSTNEKEITATERSIIDLRREVSAIDERYRSKYTTRIDELERRNNNFRTRVNDYRDAGDVQWEQFKTEMRRELDELNTMRKNIIVKNS